MKHLLRILLGVVFSTFFFETYASPSLLPNPAAVSEVNYRPHRYKEVLAFFEKKKELEQEDWNYVLYALEIFLKARPNMNGTQRMEFFEKEGEEVYEAYLSLLMAAGTANTVYINKDKARFKEQAQKTFNEEQKKWYDRLVKEYRLKE